MQKQLLFYQVMCIIKILTDWKKHIYIPEAQNHQLPASKTPFCH